MPQKSRSYDREDDDCFSVAGFSFANGFDLKFVAANGQKGEFRFRVPGTDEIQEKRIDYGNAFLFFSLFITAFASNLLWPKVIAVYLLANSAHCLLESSYKGWHWVEHQAALWLERWGSCSFDSIDPISTRCGSMVISSKGILLAATAMVYWDYGPWALPLQLSAFLAWYQTTDRGRTLPSLRPFLRRLVIAGAWPTIMIGYTIQRVFFMRRPNEYQRMWAKRWAREAAPVIASYIDGEPREIVMLAILRHFPLRRI